ncbi:hypothetical protein, partial [Blautia luti]|uniref:hypothetical protein n=1 Tax=Blautia luti TaxID=89014 RepID=UPI001A9A9A66
AFIIVENICCQGSSLGCDFYFRSKVQHNISVWEVLVSNTSFVNALYANAAFPLGNFLSLNALALLARCRSIRQSLKQAWTLTHCSRKKARPE